MANKNRKISWIKISQQLIDILPGEAYLKDIDGKYLLTNKKYLLRLYQRGLINSISEKITGKTDYAIFDLESANKFRANDQWVIDKKQNVQLEENITGSSIPNQKIISTKYPLYDMDNNVIGIIGQSYEYTQFKYKNISTYLTDKEMQVLTCKYLGYSAKKTAFLLDISHRTAESHWNSIRSKLKIISKDNLIELIDAAGWSDLLKQIYQVVLRK